MAENEGAANHDGLSPIMDMSGRGGGMSASENRMVNHRGKILYAGGGPKSTSDGKDLGKNAKNIISTPGLLDTPVSPSACTPNKGAGGGKGRNSKKGSGY